ncbi:hypothetical protein O0S10_00535 [Methanocorpusculum sp. MG]|uniref:Ribbon-helix-helix protein CopG domain-containing protein n=1 Tax=Methanocorpusculum petauri TaxID=3002863 RepID=A0ABT4IEX0_9EURY|nr:hypothetical protein [Methanocorpusculum petauri]MCZ0859710.1 hypothetical protein [Methanocorpusculum petauri]
MTKSEMVGLRVPTDLLEKIDAQRGKESIDRSTFIIRALRYWTAVEGNITTDHEFMKRLEDIENNVNKITEDVNTIKQLYELSSDQQKAINALVKLLPKR